MERAGTAAPGTRATSVTRLVHVGPHKTGTTTVQAAFHSNRGALRERGVLYLGDQLQPTTAVKAVTGAHGGALRRRGLQEWSDLTDQARAHVGTVVLSSEFLCEADDAAARRVLDDLGAAAGHQPQVVVTLRPLSKILPSQWQQFVQSGTVTPIDEWLDWCLRTFDRKPPPLVWRRHRHHDVVARWARVAGHDHVTVVVADDARPEQLPQVFADLLGLPAEVLVPPRPVANRSLTMEEAEAARLFNRAVEQLGARRAAARDRTPVGLTMDQRMAVWRAVKKQGPDPAYQRVALPASAGERVAALAQHMVEAIESLGVQVIGDLSTLTTRGTELPDSAVHPRSVRPELVAEVAAAVLAHVVTPARAAGTPPAVDAPGQSAPGQPAPTSRGRALLERLGRRRGAGAVEPGAVSRPRSTDRA